MESCGALTVKISGGESCLRDTLGSPCRYCIGHVIRPGHEIYNIGISLLDDPHPWLISVA